MAVAVLLVLLGVWLFVRTWWGSLPKTIVSSVFTEKRKRGES